MCLFQDTLSLDSCNYVASFKLGSMSYNIPFQDCFSHSGSPLFDVNFRSFFLISEKFVDGLEEL